MAIDKIQLGGSEGGIVEEITNANGTAVMFETGLMICTHIITYSEITQATGNIFRSTSATTWTFPVAFVGNNPKVDANDSSSSNLWFGTSSSLTSGTITGLFPSSLSGSRTAIVSAIGRWK